jgi:BirA family biotin operon repressor/biotin-[acetyl-CoA-carboxylase] ligase
MHSPAIDIDLIQLAAPIAGSEHHATIGSTNDRAIECASDESIALPYLVIAEQQTAGRGRSSNTWWTGAGSLAFSLLVGDDWLRGLSAQSRPMTSLAVGLAVVETVRPHVVGHDLAIHWPNDVMLDGRKLAGILIESPRPDRMVIGIGVNVNNLVADAPAELRERAISIRDITNRTHDRSQLLLALLWQMKKAAVALAASPASIAERVNALCVQRGQTIEFPLGNEVVRGLCLGVATNGGLLVDTPQGVREIWSV